MWKTIKCAVQGTGHVDKGIPCQDKVYDLTMNGVTTIALADGAGSAKLSHLGAEMVTKFICEKFCTSFDQIFQDDDGVNVKKGIVNDVTEQLVKLAKDKVCELKDLASTLLFVSVKENHFILAHIGDGIIGYLKNKELKVVQMPKKEGAVNETFFTTSSAALQQMQLIKGNLDTISGFVMMSDGTETSFYDKKKESLAEVIKKLMLMCDTHKSEVIEKLLELSFEKTLTQRTTDDCSIIILYDAEENVKSLKDMSLDDLVELFSVNSSSTDAFRELKLYSLILKTLSNGNCSLDAMYARWGINKKKKKEMLKRKLDRLQELQLIAETGDKVYSLFIREE